MAPPRRPVLESTAGAEGQDRRVQRALDGLHQDMSGLDAGDVAYTPSSAASWVSPAPTTVQQALDRLAAAGGVTPVP